MSKITQKSNFVIGVDGGGTKTIAALADLEGKILKIGKAGSSHLRNLGIEKATKNVAISIKKVLPQKGKILSTFIGLPAVAEEYREKKEKIKKEIKKYKKIAKIFEGKVKIGSDQDVALKAGIKGDGVMLNAGTGCVAIGKRKGKFVHVSGWGYLADEGGAFFVGQKTFQRVL
jgi:N-acetylglucosamine kinase-like BadF-type ATPase